MDTELTQVKIDEIEDTFADDDVDLVEMKEKLYSFYCYPEKEPTSVRFKGKNKTFLKAVDALKVLFKKGVVKTIDVTTFRVLDSRKGTHVLEYDIETEYENEKGVAVLKVYGPTPKKGATVMVSKSKEYEVKFVERLALNVLKQMVDRYVETDSWKKIFEKVVCNMCKKAFCNEKNLKTHIEKYHEIIQTVKCSICDFTSNYRNELDKHIKESHGDYDDTEYRCDTCNIVLESEEWLKGHNDEKHGTVSMDVDIEDGISNSDIMCKMCNFITKDMNIMQEHMSLKHEKESVCEINSVDEFKINIQELQRKLVNCETVIANTKNEMEKKEAEFER